MYEHYFVTNEIQLYLTLFNKQTYIYCKPMQSLKTK